MTSNRRHVVFANLESIPPRYQWNEMWVPDVRFAGLVFVSLAQHSNQTVSSERSVMWRSGVLPFLVQTLTLCCVQRFRRASKLLQSHIAHSTVSVRMRQTCAHITGSVFTAGRCVRVFSLVRHRRRHCFSAMVY